MPQELTTFLIRIARLGILEMRPLIAEESQKWTQETVEQLVAVLDRPAISAKQAGMEKHSGHDWPLNWAAATVESLGWLGMPGASALWNIVNDHPNDAIALRALVVALRQPLLAQSHHDQLIGDLEKRLPKFFRAGLPVQGIWYDMCHEANRNPAMKQLLTQLRSVTVLGPKKKDKQLLGDIVAAIITPTKPPPAPEDPAHLLVVRQFCDDLVAGEIERARALMSDAMQQAWSANKLRKEVQEVTSHCGWPQSVDEAPYFAGFRYADLADGPAEPRLPKWINESNFRGWVWASLGPPADSDSDFACNLGVGLMADRDRIAIGHVWMTAED